MISKYKTNSWPLFIGSCIIQLNIGGKVIYAPLLLKRVKVEIVGSSIKVSSIDPEIILNGKTSIHTWKREYGHFTVNQTEEWLSFDIAMNDVSETLSKLAVKKFDIKDKFYFQEC